jgi:hypothetical protein
MTYTTNYYDVFRRQGLFIDKIFKGAKPGLDRHPRPRRSTQRPNRSECPL